MFCHHCGTPLPDTAKYCKECGCQLPRPDSHYQNRPPTHTHQPINSTAVYKVRGELVASSFPKSRPGSTSQADHSTNQKFISNVKDDPNDPQRRGQFSTTSHLRHSHPKGFDSSNPGITAYRAQWIHKRQQAL
eukprot:NODE_7214_length_456_cov_6.179331_g7048_i0.p2 GENE.NODE_7214_length_456_cov_6.179331_g7048_i0~~NODE_7214_length_456_cov_6.179331_g7048_i0.p2  ORF type:complete len:133 (-),score=20.68 NODE_7214_length_456_cov_6.179331_g7048_i0:39-437(-)